MHINPNMHKTATPVPVKRTPERSEGLARAKHAPPEKETAVSSSTHSNQEGAHMNFYKYIPPSSVAQTLPVDDLKAIFKKLAQEK